MKGEVRAGAVQESSPPHNMNQFDVRPAGGNAGAFSRGFTTGPDVFNATINTTTGVVTLGLDQRIFGGNPAQISLLDSTGNVVATAPAGSVTFPIQLPGPEMVQVQFSPGQTTTAKNVSVQTGGLHDRLGTGRDQRAADPVGRLDVVDPAFGDAAQGAVQAVRRRSPGANPSRGEGAGSEAAAEPAKAQQAARVGPSGSRFRLPAGAGNRLAGRTAVAGSPRRPFSLEASQCGARHIRVP